MTFSNFNATDAVILCLLLIFLIGGWRQGFFKSALGPITFFFCAIGGMIYYDITQNFIKAILFTTMGSAIVTFAISTVFSVGKESVDPTYRNYSPLLGRILGSAMNAFWQGSILLIILLIIALAPLKIYQLNKIQDNIQHSFSYTLLIKNLSKIPMVEKIFTSFAVLENPEQMQALSTSAEFQAFFSHKKIQALTEDETFMENVRERNVSKVVADAKIWEIFKDDDLMESLGNLAMKIYSLELPESPTKSTTDENLNATQ